MNFPGITDQIAQTLSLAPEQRLLDALFADTRPSFVEWSINDDGDPRGLLRVAVWPTDLLHVRQALVRFSYPLASSIYDKIAYCSRQVGLGVALSENDFTVRLWAAPSPPQRRSLIDVALHAEPRLTEPARMLTDLCGGMTAYEGLSVEVGRGQTSRWTLYYSIPDRAAAEYLIEQIACRASRRRDAFLKAFLGIESRNPGAFPRVLIGRSIGVSSGWKLYYFVRHDPHRLPDQIVFDLVDAGPALREVWQILWEHAPSHQRPAGLVHLVGLTVPDDTHDPRTTIYFALDASG